MIKIASKSVLLPQLILNGEQARGMATLKDIRLRLKSVKNIQKITQSMKMVSAAKYARAERDLKVARSYGIGAQAFYESTECTPKDEAPKPGTLLIALTSDRGLCGAVHSGVAKKIRALMASDPNASQIKIVTIGDKAKAMLARQYKDNVILMFNDFGKRPPSFGDAITVANHIMQSGLEFDKGAIIYNRFKSVVSYSISELPVFSMNYISNSPKMSLYDSLDESVIKSYHEYSLASLLFYAMKENACSEQSSRMTAMDNASKNAGEMIQQLTLSFNRTRQGVITRELIEIISGAAAL